MEKNYCQDCVYWKHKPDELPEDFGYCDNENFVSASGYEKECKAFC